MKKLHLIACDLDGTLLQNGAQRLGPQTNALIGRLLDRGVLFYAASGRQFPNLCDLFAPVKDRIGIIAENGTVTFEDGQCLLKRTMDRGTALALAAEANSGERNCEVLVSGERTGYICPKKESFYHHLKYVVQDELEVVKDFSEIREEIVKVSLYGGEEDTDDGYWIGKYGRELTVSRGAPNWLDIVSNGADKAAALKWVCERRGIDPSECMALGDGYNDIGMLKFAGTAVAMENGVGPLKEIADYIIKDAEDFFCAVLDGRTEFILPS